VLNAPPLFFLHFFIMGIPTAIISGTIGYLVLGAVLIGFVFSSRATGALSKDNAAIANIVITIATTSMWLFWVCAWMHQWHPLIQPVFEG
jgi:V-type H+-transporting ATPase subunit e